ncbi:hypothetical protein [Streptomyces coerulescens]|uniref:Uncharacterized protein n=1 Tax=Streptomyces coerulescens TaxID=29304 RepID=A0ABW0CHA7_STRCD
MAASAEEPAPVPGVASGAVPAVESMTTAVAAVAVSAVAVSAAASVFDRPGPVWPTLGG